MFALSARSPAAASIRTRPGPHSPGAGDYGFVHDPGIPAGREPAIWLPEHSPATLILQPSSPGFDASATLDPRALGSILADRVDTDGREWVVGDAFGALHIWLRGDDAAQRPAVVLPVDKVFEVRLDIALRLVHRLHGRHVSLLPPALRLTPLQKRRLIQLLHAFDVHDAGGGPRDVAAEVLGSEHALLRSVEWKDSATRRKAIRLIRDSIALVNRGYLKLLRGK